MARYIIPSLAAIAISKVNALPQAISASSISLSTSATSVAASSAPSLDNLSPEADGWLFDPTYKPNERFWWDEQVVYAQTDHQGIQSSTIWQERNITGWLMEYAVRWNIAGSTNFFYDLLNTGPFYDQEMICEINAIGQCTSSTNGQLQPGMLTNDQFNAAMVKAAIENFVAWYQAMYVGLGNAIAEIPATVPDLATKLLPQIATPESNFWSIAGMIEQALSLVAVFCPVADIIENLTEELVFHSLKAAAGGKALSDEAVAAANDLIAATAKDINGVIKTYEGAGTAIGKFTQEAMTVMPYDVSVAGSSGVTVTQEANYTADMVEYATSLQAQLGTLLDSILDNGLAQNGIVSQIAGGGFVNVTTSRSGNWTTDYAAQANSFAMQAVGAASVSMILSTPPAPVWLFKRQTPYAAQDICNSFFQDDLFTWSGPTSFCTINDDGTWSKWITITYDTYTPAPQFYAEVFPGQSELMINDTIGSFNYNAETYVQTSLSCSQQNNLYTGAGTIDSAPLFNSPDMSNLDQSTSYNTVPCFYNTPTCDSTNMTIINACTSYRQQVSDILYNLLAQGEINQYNGPAFYSPVCTEHELLYYCAQQTWIDAGRATIEDIADSYGTYFDYGGDGIWHGLDDPLQNNHMQFGQFYGFSK